MALGANFDLHLRHSRSGPNDLATAAGDHAIHIRRMNLFLHVSLLNPSIPGQQRENNRIFRAKLMVTGRKGIPRAHRVTQQLFVFQDFRAFGC
jgi:hypothetical protein